jgi:zinc protease
MFYTVEPVQDGERITILRRVGDVQAVLAGYHIPPGTHRDTPAVDVLTQILSDSPSGRLHKALIETKKASKLHGYCYQLHDPGLLILGAEAPREAPLDSTRDTLIQTIENVIKEPPSNEELARARNKLLKQIELNLNSSDQVGVELSEWMAMGDWRPLFLHRQRLQNVSVEDVTRVAAAYLKPSNRTLGMFIPTPKPDRAEIPATPDLAEVIREYKGGEGVTAGEAFEATPANIDGRTTRKALPSGLKLALLPKKTRGDNVVAQLTPI